MLLFSSFYVPEYSSFVSNSPARVPSSFTAVYVHVCAHLCICAHVCVFSFPLYFPPPPLSFKVEGLYREAEVCVCVFYPV